MSDGNGLIIVPPNPEEPRALPPGWELVSSSPTEVEARKGDRVAANAQRAEDGLWLIQIQSQLEDPLTVPELAECVTAVGVQGGLFQLGYFEAGKLFDPRHLLMAQIGAAADSLAAAQIRVNPGAFQPKGKR